MLWTSAILAIIGLAHITVAKNSCKAASISKPEHFGLSVTNLQAKEVRGWSEYGMLGLLGAVPPTDELDFCNVTVTYTHPGLGDEINVYVWLPLEGWNGRFIAQGGGGLSAGAEGMTDD